MMSLLEWSDHVQDLVFAKVADVSDRNACSLVSRAFWSAERRTRQHLRLRCSERQLELAPTCFAAVTTLDISSVVRCDDEWSPQCLAYLARLFPNVQRLVVDTGERRWLSSGVFPFSGVWAKLQDVIFKRIERHPQQDKEDFFPQAAESLSLMECVGCGPLGMTNIERLPGPGQVLLPLKEVKFQDITFLQDEQLHKLCEADLSSLQVLSLDVNNLCSMPLLCRVLSAAKCTALQDLEVGVNTWFNCNDDMTLDLFGDVSLGVFFQGLPAIRSLTLSITGPSLVTTIPLTSALARSLRSLDISIGGPWHVDTAGLDLSSVPRLGSLESLTLVGLNHGSASQFWAQIVSVLGKCRILRRLAFDLWSTKKEGEREEWAEVLSRIAEAAPSTLTDLKVEASPLIFADEESRDLSILFRQSGFSRRLRKLECELDAGQKDLSGFVFTGWEYLEELNLIWGSGYQLPSDCLATTIKIACPSLRTLKVRSLGYLGLGLQGAHESLATVDLRIGREGFDWHLLGMSSFLYLLDDLQGLPSLTNLSLDVDYCAMFYKDLSVTTALAKLSSLRVLHLATKLRRGPLQLSNFSVLLTCPMLRELVVREDMEKSFRPLLERLYKHKLADI